MQKTGPTCHPSYADITPSACRKPLQVTKTAECQPYPTHTCKKHITHTHIHIYTHAYVAIHKPIQSTERDEEAKKTHSGTRQGESHRKCREASTPETPRHRVQPSPHSLLCQGYCISCHEVTISHSCSEAQRKVQLHSCPHARDDTSASNPVTKPHLALEITGKSFQQPE